MQRILHIDMDSYFASCEQEFNHEIAGKPVGVVKALGRTCIIAASREAKKFGVKTGTSVWDAKNLCPQIVLVPAHFDKYLEITKKFIKICENFSPYIEVFSIDELFMDVTDSQKFFNGVDNVILLIKEQLRREIGEYITCSIGLSYNRLLAKLASEIKKPNGNFEITLNNRDEVLFSRELMDVCGIGYRLERRLKNMGIKNFKTLREMPMSFLKASFGPFWSIHLKRLSYGEEIGGIKYFSTLENAKSISRTFTLFSDTRDKRKIKQTLRNLTEEVAYKLRKMKMKTRQVGVGIRGDDRGFYLHKTFKHYFNSGDEIFKSVWSQFNQMNWDNNVRFLGVWAGLLSLNESLPIPLFPKERKKERLWNAMDKVNDRFGGFTIYPAYLLGGELIRPEVNGYLGDKKYQLEDSI